jgi:DNA-binding protein HU-beta
MAGIGDIAKAGGVKYEDAAATIEGIRKLILEGVKITIQDFGTFDIDARDSKEARNVATNEKIFVKEKSVPKFRFNYTFRKKVEESVEVDTEKLNKKREKKAKYYEKISGNTAKKEVTPAKSTKKK